MVFSGFRNILDTKYESIIAKIIDKITEYKIFVYILFVDLENSFLSTKDIIYQLSFCVSNAFEYNLIGIFMLINCLFSSKLKSYIYLLYILILFSL